LLDRREGRQSTLKTLIISEGSSFLTNSNNQAVNNFFVDFIVFSNNIFKYYKIIYKGGFLMPEIDGLDAQGIFGNGQESETV